MHNVTIDQIEKNKQLIALVKEYPQVYNHNPTLQHSGETLEEVWAKIGAELEEPPAVCKKKWRLLRSSMLRYLKVFKDKATSKGNRYRPYYLLEHMDFLMPFIDDKPIIRRVKPTPIKSDSGSTSGTTTTVTIVKKDRSEEQQPTQILYSTAPNTITYNVVASSSKDSSQEKTEVQPQTQDIQQYYNAGVKIIGEDYITTYQPGEQIIYQATSAQSVDEQQVQHQECIQEQHEQQQQECVQNESKTTIIPIPNMSSISSICADASSPSEASDLYFLLGLLPDFRNLNHDQKRKVKIGILKLLDDVIVS